MPDVVVLEREPLVSGGPYPAPDGVARGEVASRALRPRGHHLWAIEAVAGPGSELRWGREHGDEALYVLSGTLQMGERTAGADDAVIVESGAPAVVAATEQTHVLHLGSTAWRDLEGGPLGPPQESGHGVHVVERDACFVLAATGTRYYADSACPTCRVTLLRNARTAAHRSPSHVHSADELIYVLGGRIRLGRDELEPGMAVAIPGGLRYGFTSDDGFDFLNFRAEASTYQGAPGDEPILETIDSFPTG